MQVSQESKVKTRDEEGNEKSYMWSLIPTYCLNEQRGFMVTGDALGQFSVASTHTIG